MTCSSCETKVKSALQMIENVTEVLVTKADNSATITMNKHIPLSDLQQALDPKYTISAIQFNETEELAIMV